MKIPRFKNNKSLQTSLLKGRLPPLLLEEGRIKKLKSPPILEYLLQAFHSLHLAQSLVHGP
jgi:hypothetical protein